MKRYKLIIATIAVLLSSCTKDLVSIDYSEINPAIFPKTAADLEAMVNAAYYPIRGGYSNGIFNTAETGVMYLSDATTEILYGPYGDQNKATLQSYLPADAAFTGYYDKYYNKISQMTNTIDLIQRSTVSDDLKKKAIA